MIDQGIQNFLIISFFLEFLDLRVFASPYFVDYYSQSQGNLLINGDFKSVQHNCKDLESITNSSKQIPIRR